MNTASNLQEALQGKKLLVFDFDGTVADTSLLHAAAFAEVLTPLGIEVDYPSIAGLKTLDAMRQCLNGAGRILDETALAMLVSAKQNSVRQMIGEALQPLPGVDAFLRWAQRRYKLAMVTSGSRGTVSLALEKLGYIDWFDPLICADEVQHAKPDPEGFLSVIRVTSTPISDVLIFEDSEVGVLAAKNAGIECFQVKSPHSFLSYGFAFTEDIQYE
jgi:HAD superfamily hydrolase (TIGR01509 family)